MNSESVDKWAKYVFIGAGFIVVSFIYLFIYIFKLRCI